MRQRPWARLAVAVAGGVGLALSAPMLSAIGQTSPPAPVLSIGPTARLVAQGAAVAVPVRVVVTCPAGAEATVNVQVAQAIGRDVAHAFGSNNDIVCDGTPQVVEVFAVSEDFRFRRGPAFVTANLFACGFFPPFPGGSCTAQAQREVQIVSDGFGFPGPPPGPPGPPPLPPGPPPGPPPLPPGPPPGPFPPFPPFPGFPGFPGIPDIPGFPFPDFPGLIDLFGGFPTGTGL